MDPKIKSELAHSQQDESPFVTFSHRQLRAAAKTIQKKADKDFEKGFGFKPLRNPKTGNLAP